MTLIERLERGLGSRELDAEVYNACPEVGRIAARLPMSQWGDRFDDGWRTMWRDREDKYPEQLRHYTTSIDAALTLVPDELSFGLGFYQEGDQPLQYWSNVRRPGVIEAGSDPREGSIGATPALALCAASLRAREAMKDG